METIEQSLTLYSEFIRHHLSESVKPNSFNSPQSLDSNLAWRRFLFSSLSHLTNSVLKNMDVNWSIWVRRAKPAIQSLIFQDFITEGIKSAISSLEFANFCAPRGQAKELVNNCLGKATSTGVRRQLAWPIGVN